MFRTMCTRTVLGLSLAVALLGVPATVPMATADELNVVALPDATPLTAVPSVTSDRSGGLVSFVRGITLRAAPGHRSGPVKLGLWHASGVGNGYRIEFTPHHGVPADGNVPGMNTGDSRCVKTIAYRYKRAPRATAAGSAITILNRQNERPWHQFYRWQIRHHHVSKAVRTAVKKISAACQRHSPFSSSITTEPVYVGQAGSGVVTALASGGQPAPAGLQVRLAGSGTTILAAHNQLNARGKAPFGYRLIAFDGGNVTSTVTGPDATRADLVVTPDGKTRLLVNPYKTTTKASSRVASKVLTKPSVTVANPYASVGVGTVRVTAHVPASADHPARYTARNAGQNHRFYVKPGRTRTLKFSADDASQVSLSYCWVKHVNQSCASQTHDYNGSTEVIAPAWITVDDQSHCCTSAGTTVRLPLSVRAGSPRFYRAWVILNGKTLQALNLSKTAGSVPKAFTVRKGHVQVKFQAYRNSDYTGAVGSAQYPYDRTFN